MNCIVCAAEANKLKNIRGRDYQIFQCPRCDLRFSWISEEPSREYYQKLYRTWNVEGVNLRGLVWGHHKFFSLVKKYLLESGSKILDVGCADGLFVKEALRRGFDAYGIDFNPDLVRIARETNNCPNIFVGELKDVGRYIKTLFDVITLFDVLEHFENPKEFVKDLKKYLKKGGYVFVSLPNRNCKPRFLPLEGGFPPHHLTWWSKKALFYLFESNGYRVLEYFTERVNPKDIAVWFDYLLTARINLIDSAKNRAQKLALREGNQKLARRLYQLKKWELDVLTAFFYLPALMLSTLGYTGTAHCILVRGEE